MQLDRPDGIAAEINVTPMIDVLLVLVIIAMILLQLRAIYPVNVPSPFDRSDVARKQAIVLDLTAEGAYRVNRLAVSEAQLEPRLHALYARRTEKILFVRSAGSRPYQDVIHAIEVARSAGIEVIGYMP